MTDNDALASEAAWAWQQYKSYVALAMEERGLAKRRELLNQASNCLSVHFSAVEDLIEGGGDIDALDLDHTARGKVR